MSKTKKLAIIRNPRLSYRENKVGKPGLVIAAMVSESFGADTFLPNAEAYEFAAAYKVPAVSELDGKPVWVNIWEDPVEGFLLEVAGPALL